MGLVQASASATIDATPAQVLAVLRDYASRPRILTDNYSAYSAESESGTTVLAFHFAAGGRERDYRLQVEEADGVQYERDELSSFVNTWTVTAGPDGGSTVTLEGCWQGAGGVGGFFEGRFAPIGLRRIYDQVLAKLVDAVASADAGL